jgi:uncharacterized iron-regulated membrane protein
LPTKGERGRAHLVNAGYNGFGTTTDGRFDLFGANGWQPLEPLLTGAARTEAAERTPIAGLPPAVLALFALGALLVGLGLGLVLLRARRRGGTPRAAG